MLTDDIDFSSKDVREPQLNSHQVEQTHPGLAIKVDEDINVGTGDCIASRNAANNCYVKHASLTELPCA